MAGVTLDQIPPATSLAGGELIWIYQPGGSQATPWVGKSMTTNQLAGFIKGTGFTSPTMRQLCAAMASQGTLVGVFNALPSDITNSYNIAWWHAYYMNIGDPFVTGFLQPTLGYTGAQMQALFTFALTFPA
jgi:hypothetical protein